MTAPGVLEVSVPTIYGESVRLTSWNIAGPHSRDDGGSVWLHLHEASDEPSNRPDDVASDFFGGIGLDAEAALELGLALQLAAQKQLSA
jgi:hypothetical protein